MSAAVTSKVQDPPLTPPIISRPRGLYSIALIVGLVLGIFAAMALIGFYQVQAGALSSFFHDVSVIASQAATAMNTTGVALAWIGASLGASLFLFGALSLWHSLWKTPEEIQYEEQMAARTLSPSPIMSF